MNPDGAIEMLTREHRTILCVIQGLGRLAQFVREGRDVDVAQLREAVAFMREFADRFHHAKEKDVLYPACIDYGLQLPGRPIAVLLGERQESRRLSDQLATSIKKYGADRAKARELAATAVDAIARLYLHHIRDEERLVFPWVKRILPIKTRERLYVQFMEIDARNPPATQERFQEFAQRLAAIPAG
ncbi:MAG TPA: hemerythrin domain-containing protein [Novosphingobium sp.]|jgi:hemerythrin-like domain-containing protein